MHAVAWHHGGENGTNMKGRRDKIQFLFKTSPHLKKLFHRAQGKRAATTLPCISFHCCNEVTARSAHTVGISLFFFEMGVNLAHT